MLKHPPPRWYQDLSIPQTKRVFALGKIIKCDHDETVTGRTQRILREIGITSTFVKISSKHLKELFKVSELDPARFLCEIYRYITGSYFEEEGYKKFYDCNERIILSAIAFLKFSETIVELHRRLPMGEPIELPKKPESPEKKPRKSAESPYLDDVTEPHDWRPHRSKLQKWREKVSSIVKPSAILPRTDHLDEHIKSLSEPDEISSSSRTRRTQRSSSDHTQRSQKKKIKKRKHAGSIRPDERETIKPKVTEVKESIFVNDSSDDFSELDSFVADLPKKFYPPGRENLSRRWQSWLHDREIEFEKLAKEADCLLDNVRETTKLIFNPDACENCCACRQSRKMGLKKQEKMPLLLIDSLILDDDGNKYVIGSLTFNSPTPSLPDLLFTLPQIIPSEEKVVKKKIINDVILNTYGVSKYIVSGVIKDIQHIPKKIRHLPVPIRNVPPCNCKENYEIGEADESEIPCAVDGECIAKKYRPNEFTGCRKCSDEHSTNKIYRDFEKACKEREDRKKKCQVLIDHTTCTLRLFHDNEVKVEVVAEPEKCTKCFEAFGKCQENPFKQIIDQINKEKLLARPKVSKNSEMREYRDNIKFSVDGMIQSDNPDNKMTGCILSGITLHTPITITPSSSSTESDLPCLSSSQHHHWSVTAFTPKPKTIKMNKHNSQYSTRRKKETFNEHVQMSIDELFAKVRQLDFLKDGLHDQLIHNENGEAIDILEKVCKDRDDKKQKPGIRIEREKGGGDVDINKDNDARKGRKSSTDKQNLSRLMKITLTKMAKEGFLLAKLPDCHKIPQLQAWIMFREGFILNWKQKNALLERTQQLWSQAESRGPIKITGPSLQISERKKEKLTHADIHRIEQELKLKKKIFHSEIRKLRVLESRAMWNLMDYQMFPSVAFKQAYFVYQASKESDGHVERPYGFSR